MATCEAKLSFAMPRSRCSSNFSKRSIRVMMSTCISRGASSSTIVDSLGEATTPSSYSSSLSRADGGGTYFRHLYWTKMAKLWCSMAKPRHTCFERTSRSTILYSPNGRKWCTLMSWSRSRCDSLRTPQIRTVKMNLQLRQCLKLTYPTNGVSTPRWRQITICQTNLPYSSECPNITDQ